MSASLVWPTVVPTDDPVVPPAGGTSDWPALRPVNSLNVHDAKYKLV